MKVPEVLKKIFIRRYADKQLLRECHEIAIDINNRLLPELEQIIKHKYSN